MCSGQEIRIQKVSDSSGLVHSSTEARKFRQLQRVYNYFWGHLVELQPVTVTVKLKSVRIRRIVNSNQDPSPGLSTGPGPLRLAKLVTAHDYLATCNVAAPSCLQLASPELSV